MYVCICNSLSDRALKEALTASQGCAAGAYRALGCQPRCGKCIAYVFEMARETRIAGEAEPAAA